MRRCTGVLAVGGLLLALLLAACASGGVKPAAEVGELQIFDPFARVGLEEGAVYFAVRNAGAEDDALVGASSPVAEEVGLHSTMMMDGSMRMMPVERVPLPAGGWMALSPGGYHIMLMGLQEKLEPGDVITVELRFQRAGTVTLQVPVRAFVEEGGH